uniref:Uncharacterized protein n=1 Tax=Esox lucius TaxID=8010 RepID=A0A3P8Y0Z0_ESOLU
LWNEVLNTSPFPFARMYESNIEDLGYELHQFRRILERKIQSGMQKPSSVVELALFIEPYKEVFFELFKLCKILVKTYLRSTMSDDRLSNLGVLSIESRRAKALNLDEFADLFAKKHKNCRIQLM